MVLSYTKYKENYKRCWICKKVKPKAEFYKDSARYDNASTRCKECDKSYRREAKMKYHKKRYHTPRKEIIKLLGGKCTRCGFSDFRVLQIDHVKGGGNKERKKIESTRTYYPYVLEKIKNGSLDYQVLCANCNWIKKFENKEN